MATATCVLSGIFLDPSGTAIVGATVSFSIQTPTVDNTGNYVLGPTALTTTTASDGSWSLTLAQGLSGTITLACPPDTVNATRPYTFPVQIPVTTTTTFVSAWQNT